MPQKKKTPVQQEPTQSERPGNKELPEENPSELTERDLETVAGGADATGLQSALDPPSTLLYY